MNHLLEKHISRFSSNRETPTVCACTIPPAEGAPAVIQHGLAGVSLPSLTQESQT